MTSKFRKGHGSRFRDLWLRNPSICVTHLTHDPFTHDLFWCRVKQTHLKILQLMLGHIVRSLSLPVLAVLHDIWWTVQLDADWLIVNNQVFHMYRSCLVIITSFHKRPTTQGILFSFRSIIKCEQTKQKKQSYIWKVNMNQRIRIQKLGREPRVWSYPARGWTQLSVNIFRLRNI